MRLRNDDQPTFSLKGEESAGGDPSSPTGLSPAELIRLMPVRPVFSNENAGWRHITLFKYKLSSSEITVPPTRDHRMALQIDGVALLEAKRENGARQRYWSSAGLFSIMPAGSPVTWTVKGQPEAVLLHIQPELINETGEEFFGCDPARIQLPDAFAKQDASIERFVRVLLEEAQQAAPDSRLVADLVSRALVTRLLSRLSAAEPSQGSTPALAGRRLRRVLECIHAELRDDLSLSRLAGISGISQSHFGRAFREAMGTSPHQYITRLRLELARKLLENTKFSITEVSAQCGYDHPSHFATMFRKTMGISPSTYREGFGSDHHE